MVEDERSMGLQPFDQQPSNGHKRSNLDTIHTPRHRRAWQENVHGGNSSSVGKNTSPFTSPAVLVSLNSPSLPTLGIGGKERRVGGVYGGHGFYG
ncbi:hypothetical protein D5086_021978 [Populus alba]|uniref:Uncharacterized protein n=1 Tax=Populus alba TaxID=43335 RepID=A0ACC4BDP5_POPAL